MVVAIIAAYALYQQAVQKEQEENDEQNRTSTAEQQGGKTQHPSLARGSEVEREADHRRSSSLPVLPSSLSSSSGRIPKALLQKVQWARQSSSNLYQQAVTRCMTPTTMVSDEQQTGDDARIGTCPNDFSDNLDLDDQQETRTNQSNVLVSCLPSDGSQPQPATIPNCRRMSQLSTASSFSLPAHPPSTTNATGETQEDVFRPSVRKEWIRAVFGRDFLRGYANNEPQVQHGIGLSGIGNYTAYKVRIPPSSSGDDKVGVTMSRLPLGLYVRRVVVGSEASWAGIRENSVLVSINGMALLAEPSVMALERVLQYEGHFQYSKQERARQASFLGKINTTAPSPESLGGKLALSREGAAANTTATVFLVDPSTGKVPGKKLAIREPVILKFIQQGELYSVVMLSNPPWGIQWAPCGNFCLVKRAYNAAAAAGVKRGTLVAAVNDTNLWQSDYSTIAFRMRDLWQGDNDIWVTLAFTPEASRSGYFERQSEKQERERQEKEYGRNLKQQQQKHNQRSRLLTQTADGVQVKLHPLEHALNGLMCQAGIGPSKQNTSRQELRIIATGDQQGLSLSELAERVAAGTMLAPTSLSMSSISVTAKASSNRNRNYGPCPPLLASDLMEVWNPVEALLYCLRAARAGYEEGAFLALHHAQRASPMHALQDITTGLPSANILSCFLLQFLSLICSPDQFYIEQEGDEKKDDGSAAEQRQDPYAKELTGMLLKLSRRDDDFCQYLYYILRSYISTFEKRPSPTRSGDKIKDNSQHLMALLHCLELLRFAEKELSQQGKVRLTRTTSAPTGTSSDSTCSRNGIGPSLVVSTVASSTGPTTPASAPPITRQAPPGPEQAVYKKKKGVFGFLKKKRSRLSSDAASCSSASARPPRESSKNRTLPASSRHLRGSTSDIDAIESNRTTTSSNILSFEPCTRPTTASVHPETQSSFDCQNPAVMYENMSQFLGDLDNICSTIERSLNKTFRQKIAEWTMQPWSDTKDTALAQVTKQLRSSLLKRQEEQQQSGSETAEHEKRNTPLLVNPVQSSELLSSVDCDECYILPSAHFPILLTFNVSDRRCSDSVCSGEERIYLTTVELMFLRGSLSAKSVPANSGSVVVHAAVAGSIVESGKSRIRGGSVPSSTANDHVWDRQGKRLQFQTRSSWGAPQTLTLRLSFQPTGGNDNECSDIQADSSSRGANALFYNQGEEIGYSWVDLSGYWKKSEERNEPCATICQAKVLSLESTEGMFDEQGCLMASEDPSSGASEGSLELALKISTECVDLATSDIRRRRTRAEEGKASSPSLACFSRKRMLLYKHDDDLRQEAFAVQFIRVCDSMLKASGLDLKLLTFRCVPVGTRRGFVEWVPGSVPLSEICQSLSTGTITSIFKDTTTRITSAPKDQANDDSSASSPSMFAKAGLTKYESLRRLGSRQNETFRNPPRQRSCSRGSFANNPIQEYLRSVAYDAVAPYLIKRSVMDTYVKSCAGYSVITYILGVGDRHLDNLLLHQSGSFFHCDYSFILGSDPKMYLPLRVTEDMVHGFGGRESDNYAKFLSLTGAAFLALRRPENVRVLLNMVRLVEASRLPDVSENQSCFQAVKLLRDRLRLDLTEQDAVAYMEQLVEASLSNKLWIAVDAIHSLGKKF